MHNIYIQVPEILLYRSAQIAAVLSRSSGGEYHDRIYVTGFVCDIPETKTYNMSCLLIVAIVESMQKVSTNSFRLSCSCAVNKYFANSHSGGVSEGLSLILLHLLIVISHTLRMESFYYSVIRACNVFSKPM
jgi:hypothetical protein